MSLNPRPPSFLGMHNLFQPNQCIFLLCSSEFHQKSLIALVNFSIVDLGSLKQLIAKTGKANAMALRSTSFPPRDSDLANQPERRPWSFS
ncbi:hypothetical protein N665_0532s0057 [Sinapis alba]|nr:hypothetical protein N665_0532s0057 [Sinapis alba]